MNFDSPKFHSFLSDCSACLLSVPDVLKNAIQLTESLARDIPKLRPLQTITVQPRHYQRIADSLVSPDPVFEIVHWNILV